MATRWNRRRVCVGPGDARACPQGRADGGHRARDRRDRNRQGAAGARHPHLVAPRRRPVRERQLRRDSADADRVGAVRPRARRVHGRPAAAARPLRARGRRNALPRRGGRAAHGDAGAPAARAPGARVRADRRHGRDVGRRACRRGHEPRSRRRRSRTAASAATSTIDSPSSRSRCRRCASAPETSGSSRSTSSALRPRGRQDDPRHRPGGARAARRRTRGRGTCASSRT